MLWTTLLQSANSWLQIGSFAPPGEAIEGPLGSLYYFVRSHLFDSHEKLKRVRLGVGNLTLRGDRAAEVVQTSNMTLLTPMDESVAGTASGSCGASGPTNDRAAGVSATEGVARSESLNVFTPVRRCLGIKSLGPYHTARVSFVYAKLKWLS